MSTLHLAYPLCNAANRVLADKLQAELNTGRCLEAMVDEHPNNLGDAAFRVQLAKA